MGSDKAIFTPNIAIVVGVCVQQTGQCIRGSVCVVCCVWLCVYLSMSQTRTFMTRDCSSGNEHRSRDLRKPLSVAFSTEKATVENLKKDQHRLCAGKGAQLHARTRHTLARTARKTIQTCAAACTAGHKEDGHAHLAYRGGGLHGRSRDLREGQRRCQNPEQVPCSWHRPPDVDDSELFLKLLIRRI